MDRRNFLLGSLIIPNLRGQALNLIEPADLAARLKRPGKPQEIICVTFPVLYRQKHIPGARFAGPGSKPAGIDALHAAVQGLSRSQQIVIYCGCCPMQKCPNVRPAYPALKEMAFQHVRVLDLPENFHTDWVVRGYPVET